jgi:ABC-type glutathione transport system ATPase component
MCAAESEPYVEVANVSKVYQNGRADAIEAVSSVSFVVPRGQFVAILGPSGRGKSTLLMMVGGLEPVTAGTIAVGGTPMTGPRTVDRPEAREHGLGRSDPVAFSETTDLVMQYLTSPGMKRPDPDSLFTNRFAGKIMLAEPQWGQVHARVAEFDKYLS